MSRSPTKTSPDGMGSRRPNWLRAAHRGRLHQAAPAKHRGDPGHRGADDDGRESARHVAGQGDVGHPADHDDGERDEGDPRHFPALEGRAHRDEGDERCPRASRAWPRAACTSGWSGPTKAPSRMMMPMTKHQASPACHAATGMRPIGPGIADAGRETAARFLGGRAVGEIRAVTFERVDDHEPRARVAFSTRSAGGTARRRKDTSLPSASPKPPGSTKSRWTSIMTSAVVFGSNSNS